MCRIVRNSLLPPCIHIWSCDRSGGGAHGEWVMVCRMSLVDWDQCLCALSDDYRSEKARKRLLVDINMDVIAQASLREDV